MKKIIGMAALVLFIGYNANAQHEHHNMPGTSKPKKQMSDTMKMDHHHMQNTSKPKKQMSDTAKMDHDHMHGMNTEKQMNHNMSHAYSLNLPMNRNGSGTGWLPDAAPMYGYMHHSPKWMYMLHGNLFLRYNNQDFTKKGTRGNSEIDAPNWLMFMG